MHERKIIQYSMSFIIILLIIYVIKAIKINEIIEIIKQVNIYYLIYAMGLVSVFIIISAYRWKKIVAELDAPISQKFFNCLGFCAFGYLCGLVVPSRIGYYGKVPLLLKFDHVTLTKSIAAVNIETLLDLYYFAIASILSIFIFMAYKNTITPISIGSIFFLFFVFALISFVIYLKFDRIIMINENVKKKILQVKESNLFFKTGKKIILHITSLIFDTRDFIINKNLIIQLLFFTILSQIVAVFGLYLIILSIETDIPLIYLFAILQISYVVGIISMIPGGFGSSDLTLIFLLQQGGLQLSESLNIAVLWRVCTIIPLIFFGTVFAFQSKLCIIPQKINK